MVPPKGLPKGRQPLKFIAWVTSGNCRPRKRIINSSWIAIH